MKKNELIKELADRTGLPQRACKDVLEALGEVGLEALQQARSLTLPGLGKFALKQLSARNFFAESRLAKIGADLQPGS